MGKGGIGTDDPTSPPQILTTKYRGDLHSHTSGGFTTTVFPVARATLTFLTAIRRGWFQGVTSAQTPRGTRVTVH